MNKVDVAKIVASSSPTAWSQVYHAGSVTAVVSLTLSGAEEHVVLPAIGKEILNNFEAEYFSLETKNLISIKQAIEGVTKKIPENIVVSFVISVLLETVLYVFIAGSGFVLLKRNGKIGTLLENENESRDFLSASGFLEDSDIVVLGTKSFGDLISKEEITTTLSLPATQDMAESLSPKIHAQENGSVAAAIFSYRNPKSQPKVDEPTAQKVEESLPEIPPEPFQESPIPTKEKRNMSLPKLQFSHRQKLFLTIAVILIIVLVITAALTLSKNKDRQQQALFTSIFPPAEKKYEEGVSLIDLNKNLAQDDFTQAQAMLDDSQNKFPANSPEAKQIIDLKAKITTQLQTAANVNQTPANKVDNSSAPLLAFASKQNATYVTEDANNFYNADNSGVTKVDKKSNAPTQIIKNSTDYKNIGGFEIYFGNIYILDTKDGIDKYVPSGTTFSKSSYFSGTTPDLSKAVAITIDGSIWILQNDGSILKYTKGAQDSLTISGLDKPLSSPTKIVTNIDDDNVYILDNGNGRIVVLKKDGSFVAQYVTGILKQAAQLSVDEKNKKAFTLSSGAIYEIDLK